MAVAGSVAGACACSRDLLKETSANAKQMSTAAANAAQTAAEAQKKARALETAGQLLSGTAVSLAAWQSLVRQPTGSWACLKACVPV